MGFYASAILVWGVPVAAYDEDGEPTAFWDEEGEDWRNFEGELYVHQYGHYENPDGPRGILSSKRVKPLRGDCWDPTQVTPMDLDTPLNNDKLYSKSEDQARYNKLPVSFYGDAKWWLVASFG
jgi:hypothetical protein